MDMKKEKLSLSFKNFTTEEIEIICHNHSADKDEVLRIIQSIEVKEKTENTTYFSREIFSKLFLEKIKFLFKKRKIFIQIFTIS